MSYQLILCVFSFIGTLRTGCYMLKSLSTAGFTKTVCDLHFFSDPVGKFWAFVFVLSKAPELGTIPHTNTHINKRARCKARLHQIISFVF